MGSVKVKVTPRHAYGGTEWRRRYSSNPFATSALEEGSQHHAPAALPPRNTRYPQYGSLGEKDGQYTLIQKISSQGVSIPGPSSPYQFAIPTTLSRPPYTDSTAHKITTQSLLPPFLPNSLLTVIHITGGFTVHVPDSVVKRSTDSETMTQPPTNKQTNNNKDNRLGSRIKYTSPHWGIV
jgi:hypothetical protein